MSPAPGLLVAAPRSGSGKTTVVLGLQRALARRGLRVRGLKCGPDYIDPAFHAAATGAPSFNLDSFAMSRPLLEALAAGGRSPEDVTVRLAAAWDGGAWLPRTLDRRLVVHRLTEAEGHARQSGVLHGRRRARTRHWW